MTGAKLWLASSLIATTGVAVTDTWQGWEKLGLAGVLLVFIAVLYRSSEKLREKHEADMMKREEMLRDALMEMARQAQRTADFIGQASATMVEINKVMEHCKTKGEG
jgi:K+ transporter